MDSIILQTGDTTVVNGDVIGRLGFAAPAEAGTNARLVVAKIEAVAEEAFDASNNATEMVFYLAADGAAAAKMTLTSVGNLNLGGELQTTNIGYTDGDNSMTIADGGKVTFAAGFAVGSDAAGDTLYYNGTSYVRLGIGTDGQVLTVNDTANAPQWEASAGGGGTPTAITVADESTDTTCFPLFVTATTGDLEPKSGTNLAFNSSAGILTATGFAGDITGDVTGNADTVTNGVYTSNNLSVMAATTSAQLAGVISNETGGGALVFGTSPTLVTPALGTPSALVGTNISGTAASLTTGKVTVSDSIANTAFPVAFHDESNALLDDTGAFTYNPSSSTVAATTFSGALTGNSSTATKLATARAIAVAGDVTGTANFDGSAAISITTTLASASVDFAHVQNVAANSILGRNANSSGVLSEIALTTTQILIGDGTGFTAAALSGDVTMTNGGVVSIADDVISSAELADACTAVTSFTAPLIEGSTSVQTPLIEYTDGDDAIAIADGGLCTFPQLTTFSKATKPALKANTDGVTVTFDANEANMHTVTLGGNRTFAISNETAGQRFMIRILQDGTGSRTVTWFSTIKWAGGSAPTLTTTASKADVFGFLVTGTDTYDGFVIGQNI